MFIISFLQTITICKTMFIEEPPKNKKKKKKRRKREFFSQICLCFYHVTFHVHEMLLTALNHNLAVS